MACCICEASVLVQIGLLIAKHQCQTVAMRLKHTCTWSIVQQPHEKEQRHLHTGWVYGSHTCILSDPWPARQWHFRITWTCYRSHFGPSGPKLEKESENGFPGPLGPGAQKVQNGVEIEPKSIVFQLSTPFSTFWAPGLRGPRELIFGLFF